MLGVRVRLRVRVRVGLGLVLGLGMFAIAPLKLHVFPRSFAVVEKLRDPAYPLENFCQA